MSLLRLRSRRAFYRSRMLREIAAVARWPRVRSSAPDIAHLAFYEEYPWGPVQRDEALLLHALIRTLRPATVVEIGFLYGDSAFNFLTALDPQARLYSFDVDPACVEFARARCEQDPRFVLRLRSQDTLTAEDFDGRPVDFVFLDGAHELTANQATFARLLPLLSARAVIAIHDTGGLPRSLTPSCAPALALKDRWAGDEFEHQPGERAFVNWLLQAHPEFAQIHLHSNRAVRHGITLVQRSAPLHRP
ncbi:MAG: class I SAM-dependent methyltransferase [Solirubrobacterales bacterium]|nr:class I SAM-dependent methyltransferase [Solirubrobacterales bacterium]